eukprot:697374-Pelagomonas_calceolata.AAC.1
MRRACSPNRPNYTCAHTEELWLLKALLLAASQQAAIVHIAHHFTDSVAYLGWVRMVQSLANEALESPKKRGLEREPQKRPCFPQPHRHPAQTQAGVQVVRWAPCMCRLPAHSSLPQQLNTHSRPKRTTGVPLPHHPSPICTVHPAHLHKPTPPHPSPICTVHPVHLHKPNPPHPKPIRTVDPAHHHEPTPPHPNP